MIKPLTQTNKHSCALACLITLLNENGDTQTTQETAIEKFRPFFAEWQTREGFEKREGLLTAPDMLVFLGLNNLLPSYFLFTYERDEFLSTYERRKKKYCASFLMPTTPEAHCIRIDKFNGENVEFMDPRISGAFNDKKPWTHFDVNEPSYLLFTN